MVLPLALADLLVVHLDASTHGDAGGVDGLRVARDQGMPPVEVLSIGDEAIGARRRQPVDAAHQFRRQRDAIWHVALAVLVVGTLAALAFEHETGDIGEIGVAGLLLLQLDEAATATAIAKALPLLRRERFEGLGLPERFGR